MTYGKNTRRGFTQRSYFAGFTLIELLVVVLIIGILASVALPQYQKTVLKARYTQAQVLGRALQESVDMYYLANGTYPVSLENLELQLPGTMSVHKREVSADGYRCYLDVRNNTLDSLWCDLTSVPTNSMLSYRFALLSVAGNKKGRFCVARGAQNEEICKLVGGREPFDNGGGLMHYRLP